MRNRHGAPTPRVTETDRNGKQRPRPNFEEAFGFSGYETKYLDGGVNAGTRMRGQSSYDEENIRLAPYSHVGGGGGGSRRTHNFGRGSDSIRSQEQLGLNSSPMTTQSSDSGGLVEPSARYQPQHARRGSSQIGVAL